MLISRIVHKLQKISQRQQERAPCPHPFCIQQAPILWPKVVFHVFVFYAHWVLQNIQIDSVIAFKMSNFFKIVVSVKRQGEQNLYLPLNNMLPPSLPSAWYDIYWTFHSFLFFALKNQFSILWLFWLIQKIYFWHQAF